LAEYTVPSSVTTITAAAASWNNNNGVNPGDTLILATGSRSALTIQNLNGSATGGYVTIRNGNGRTTISTGGSFAIHLINSTYIRISGTGSNSIFYGILIQNFSSAGVRSFVR
jgi:hypothetical protein